MTAIAGIANGESVWIGGDSAGVGGYGVTVRADTKVFSNGPYLFGFTTSFRMGQLLHHSFEPPVPPESGLDKFLVTTFIDKVRDCLKTGGYASVEHNVETGGTFLLGTQGRLFRIDTDYQVGEASDGYDAVGCGEDYCIGSLHTTEDSRMKPKARLTAALEAAAYHNGGVSPPFVIERMRYE